MKKFLILLLIPYLASAAMTDTQSMIKSSNTNMMQTESSPKTQQDVINLVNAIENAKLGWLDFEKELHDAKYNQLLKDHKQIFEHKKEFFKKLGMGNVDYDQLFDEMLANYKATSQEWQDLYAKFNDKAQQLKQKQMKEFAQFEPQMEEETETEEELIEE